MQFFVYFTRDPNQPMKPPTREGMAAMTALMQESIASGLVVSTGQLGGATTHVTLDDGELSVTDGPFIEGTELIPGFTVIEVDSKDAAVAWVTELRRCMGDGTLRMTPVYNGASAEARRCGAGDASHVKSA